MKSNGGRKAFVQNFVIFKQELPSENSYLWEIPPLLAAFPVARFLPPFLVPHFVKKTFLPVPCFPLLFAPLRCCSGERVERRRREGGRDTSPLWWQKVRRVPDLNLNPPSPLFSFLPALNWETFAEDHIGELLFETPVIA